MSRLNSRQKRAAKRRLALHALALSRNPSMVSAEGQVKSSQVGFDRMRQLAYKRPAVRPTITPGVKKSGPCEVVKDYDPTQIIDPATVTHKGDMALKPSVRPHAPKKLWALDKL